MCLSALPHCSLAAEPSPHAPAAALFPIAHTPLPLYKLPKPDHHDPPSVLVYKEKRREGGKACSACMADQQVLEGTQPVDLAKHPSGIVPTLQ